MEWQLQLKTHAHNREVPSSNPGHDIQPDNFGIFQLRALRISPLLHLRPMVQNVFLDGIRRERNLLIFEAKRIIIFEIKISK